ncbi:hypothetical protein T265_11717 [Opisthorchis viverrini]|uniref:Reverse transcriptase domain-containing protein n=1 Tax=Opisthorchis viverrini TaxID=6198 RepID=A0A074Z8I1_OPIVI|nr:hypothetical protein T265_11717 [Opisthorchis viverrini]KER19540.1 hypothetical protein T265_11717 [Opisthorchis viverrini]
MMPTNCRISKNPNWNFYTDHGPPSPILQYPLERELHLEGVMREYADDIVLMFEEEKKAQVFLDELSKVIPSFGMHFAPIKCKVMLVDVQSLNMSFTIQGEALEVVEHFTYLGSCISSDCSVTDEVNARVCKARAAFADLRHLGRPHCGWLETLQDVTTNRCQWRSFCQFLSRSPEGVSGGVGTSE